MNSHEFVHLSFVENRYWFNVRPIFASIRIDNSLPLKQWFIQSTVTVGRFLLLSNERSSSLHLYEHNLSTICALVFERLRFLAIYHIFWNFYEYISVGLTPFAQNFIDTFFCCRDFTTESYVSKCVKAVANNS